MERYIEFYYKCLPIGNDILPNGSTEKIRMSIAKSLNIKKFDNYKIVTKDPNYTNTWYTHFDGRDCFMNKWNYIINNHCGKQLAKMYKKYND